MLAVRRSLLARLSKTVERKSLKESKRTGLEGEAEKEVDHRRISETG